MFGQDRGELRRMYADAWRKRTAGRPLSPLEAQIADVVDMHPEYHEDVSSEDLDRDFAPEDGKSNPFLHMGLHLGIREQVSTDRPAGIAAVYHALAARTGDLHAAEHEMIECLAETLWESQSGNHPPDEDRYLERLRRLAGSAL
ncbi:MAG: DUF1841 family protein [Gammaproteobacteria bacterium]|nr:DUF1841 family protein [Gammaproteobacteria bacterium]MBT8104235.1 DUF1841 family protein [Gammaproteobacteria bacterium]NNF49074.1 DUF1841 family protein [Woeseiaceae bacterium]NNK24250.1 DUF1841 family protein [Woeseiaceae bacterium]NNL63863.1 DUF1841 family protein [Woeseiaceae bacterium]